MNYVPQQIQGRFPCIVRQRTMRINNMAPLDFRGHCSNRAYELDGRSIVLVGIASGNLLEVSSGRFTAMGDLYD